MNVIKMLEIKRECQKLQREERLDCSKCPLAVVVTLKLAVQSFGVLEDGDIKIPVNPCLLLSELSNLVKREQH